MIGKFAESGELLGHPHVDDAEFHWFLVE